MIPVGHLRRLWLYLLAGLIMLFLMAPTLIVVPMSFSGSDFLQFPPRTWSTRWYGAYLDSLEWRSATWISLQAACGTVLLATPLGTAAAYGLYATRSRLAGAVLVALTTPMIVPVIFVAIGAFYLYARIGLLYSVTGLVLAHATLAMPFVVALVAAGLRGHDPQLERAARSLGASRPRAFFSVTLPQIRFSVLSAVLLAFLTSFDEVVVALLVAGSDNATITRRMFTMLRDQIDPSIAAISSLLIALSMGLGLLLQALRAARPGRR